MKINAWHPVTEPVSLKHLGKLAEECGELASATARCIIQGIDETEPTTNKNNRIWLEEEIADVLANIELVTKHFKLNRKLIRKRKSLKQARLIKWHRGAAA